MSRCLQHCAPLVIWQQAHAGRGEQEDRRLRDIPFGHDAECKVYELFQMFRSNLLRLGSERRHARLDLFDPVLLGLDLRQFREMFAIVVSAGGFCVQPLVDVHSSSGRSSVEYETILVFSHDYD